MSQGYYLSAKELLLKLLPEAGVEIPQAETLEKLKISPSVLVRDPVYGLITETRLIVGQRFELRLPGMEWLYLSFGGSEQPIRLAYSLQPTVSGELGPLPVSLHIENALLLPMRRVMAGQALIGFEPDPTRSSFTLSIDESYLSYHAEQGLGVGSRFVVSVPPFKIAGTELILAAEQATLIFRDDAVDHRLTALGFDSGFRGLYALEGVLYWLPQIQLAGYNMPGLRLDFANLAIGNQGVSFSALSSWLVVLNDAGGFDQEQTELLGALFAPRFAADGAPSVVPSSGLSLVQTDWQLAIAQVGGTVHKNLPQGFLVKAYLRIPFFAAVFSCDFRLAYKADEGAGPAYATVLTIRKESAAPIVVSHLNGQVEFQLTHLALQGWLSDQGFALSGEAGFVVDLFGLEIAVENAALDYTHLQQSDTFRFSMSGVTLGELGSAEQADLTIKVRHLDDGWIFEELSISAQYRWQSLSALIPDDIKNLVDLPGDGRIEAKISWEESPGDTAARRLLVRLLTGVSNLDRLWHFIPQQFRPVVEHAETVFKLSYASTAHFTANADGSSQAAGTREGVDVELSGLLRFSLPGSGNFAIPNFELVQLHSGTADGLIEAEFNASYHSDLEQEQAFQSGLSLSHPFAMDLVLPGGRAGVPFVHNALTKLGLQFEAGSAGTASGSSLGVGGADKDVAVGGRLLAEGSFEFRPLVPAEMPFAEAFNGLMRQVGLDHIVGQSSLALAFSDDSFDLDLSGRFDEFGIEIDLFGMLAALASGSAGPSAPAFEIDFDISFKLVGFRFRIGYGELPGASGSDEFRFQFDLQLACKITGLPELAAAISLSNEEFSLGLENLDIPFELPLYPIDNRDLDRLRGVDGRWSPQQLHSYAQELGAAIETYQQQLQQTALDERQRFRLTKDKLHLELKRLLLQLTMQIQQRVAPDGRPVFEGLVEADTWVHATALRLLHLETELKLHFPEIKLKIPFADPSGIALMGTGQLVGFADDDPFKAIESYSLSLGLSSEYIFVRFDSDGTPIPIPSFGTRYDDGSISISKFMLGYGYSKNSFALDFAGSLIIPFALQQDADTSDELGVGINLPRYSQLAFTIDMIPVTIGKASFILPVPRFDLDLRNPNVPALVSTTSCEPYWDGLQFIARDLTRVAFKRLAFSPFFGFSITPNIKFDGDLRLGNQQQGLTLIADDILLLLGTYAGAGGALLQVPFFSDPLAPFFSNICVNLRAAGFQLNFNLQRPFPSFSPMALIEVFALISDPLVKIDPKGSLANTIRFSLTDAYLQVPDFVLQMFPEAAQLTNRSYNFTLNLGTLISMVQGLAALGKPVVDALSRLATGMQTDIEQLVQQLEQSELADFNPWRWIKLLPPELRKFRVGGRIAGFQGSACIVLATLQEAKAGLGADGGATPLPALNTVTKGGGSITYYRPHKKALYKPGSGYRFKQFWKAEDGAEAWSQITNGIGFSGAQTLSHFFYQGKKIPNDFQIGIRIRQKRWHQNILAGCVFCWSDNGTHYRFTLSPLFVESGRTDRVAYQLVKQTAGSAKVLLRHERPAALNGNYQFLLTSYLNGAARHFELHDAVEESIQGTSAKYKAQDADAALGKGLFGLAAAGPVSTVFDELLITPISVQKRALGKISQKSLRQGFNVNLPEARQSAGGRVARTLNRDESGVLFQGLEFNAFTAEDIEHIPADHLQHLPDNAGSVWLAARLNLFQGQRFRFFGRLFEDGSFALLSQLVSKPLRLSVLGLDIQISFQLASRLLLTGRQKRSGYYGAVEVEGYLDWSPIPNIIRLRAGSKSRGCRLRLQSDGEFAISGHGKIELFAGAALIQGMVDISRQQARFAGDLYYELGAELPGYPFRRILALDIKGEGLVESMSRYQFRGRGEVTLLGDRFQMVEVFFNERVAEFALHYRKRVNTGATDLERQFPILTRCDIELNGHCRVNLRRTLRPEFRLGGEGHIRVLGAEIAGRGELRSLPKPGQSLQLDGFQAVMQGNLLWQGRTWLGGRLEVGSNGMALSGETSFGLDLTPKKVPGTTLELASLFIDVNLSGEFRLDAEKQSIHFLFKGHWTLGAAMADTGNGAKRQILPLASSRFNFSSNAGLNQDQQYALELIHIKGFSFLPMGHFTIPLPSVNLSVKENAASLVRIGEIDDISAVRFKLPGDDNYFWLQGQAPFVGRPAGEWESGSLRVYRHDDYRIRFSNNATSVNVDLSPFSEFRVALVLDPDMEAGFPMRLKLSSPGGSRSFGLD